MAGRSEELSFWKRITSRLSIKPSTGVSRRFPRSPSFPPSAEDTGSKQTILLVLFEGLAETVIGSTVLDHARILSSRGNSFEIWAFCCSWAVYRKSCHQQKEARR